MFIGQSPETSRIKKMIREAGKTNDPVLIAGETGSGKELAAREIHERSKQKNRPFVTLNCAAIGDTLDESDLFGATIEGPRGVERKIGLIEQAKKGIIYLENLQDLNEVYQQKFMNMISEKKYKQTSTQKILDFDVRIIAATTEMELGKNKSFRKDLLTALNGFTINIPPLRKRKQDIPYLFMHFLKEFCDEFKNEIPSVPSDLFESLMEYEWHGNITELKNAVKNLVLMSPEGSLSVEYLPFEVIKHPFEYLVGKDLPEAVSEVESYLIRKSLQRFAGNQTKAARALSVSEAALRYKMKKYGLSKKAF